MPACVTTFTERITTIFAVSIALAVAAPIISIVVLSFAPTDDSARSVGASRLNALRRVQLPLLRPALLGAVIVVFVDCLK